jgi:hypothetical protein
MKYIFFAITLLFPIMASAASTGTALVPNAEVLQFGETRATYEFSGSGRLDSTTTGSTYGLQTGMLGGIETGIDYDSNSNPIYNVKWQYNDYEGPLPAIAIGMQNLGSKRKVQYYAVATASTPYKLMSASFGLLRKSSDEYITMASAEAKYDMLKLSADYANGGGLNRHSYSAGIETSNITLTYTRYHIQNSALNHSFMIGYKYSSVL